MTGQTRLLISHCFLRDTIVLITPTKQVFYWLNGIVSEGIVIGWKRLESTKLGLVHTSVMDSGAAGVSQIGTRCPTV